MIELSKYDIFRHQATSLKETSSDDRNKKEEAYMTESDREAVDFDKVKAEYIEGLGLHEIPKSNDALLDDGRGTLVFVEFKNGLINSAEQFAIRKKIYDSVLIFSDITSMGISKTREIMKYILVYNETRNMTNHSDSQLAKKNALSVQPSPSFDTFAKTISGYAKEEYVYFGLRMFEKYCFKEVHTFTEAEFESYLESLPPNVL